MFYLQVFFNLTQSDMVISITNVRPYLIKHFATPARVTERDPIPRMNE